MAEKYGDGFIPALEQLEPGLGIVPGFNPNDPNAKSKGAEWRHRWFAWRDRVEFFAAQMTVAASGNHELQAAERILCAQDWAYHNVMYGWTYDPRIREGQGVEKPFTLFAIQANKIQEIQRVVFDPRKIDIMDSKSRGIGWTDTYAGAALSGWQFTNHAYHFVSFKEDKVYKRNDRASIFGKILFKLEKQPHWLLPDGFLPEEHMLRLNLFNPETGASITGESTTERTGRGDRRTAIFYDEAAFVEGGFYSIYEVGGGTTNHRFSWSTESYQYGDDWEILWTTEKKEGNPDHVWEIDWWHNPYQDEDWYFEEKARHKGPLEVVFAREYERNALLAEAGLMYPAAQQWRGIDTHYDPTKTLIVSIDPGHAQDTGIVWGQPVDRDGRKGVLWLGSYKRNNVPVSFYAHLLTGIRPEEGDECWDLWTSGQFSDRDRRLMEWFRVRVSRTAAREEWTQFCMDPAGKQEHAGTSFFGMFYEATTKLLRREWERNGSKGPKPKGIAPHYKFLQEQGNLIVDRVNCTQLYLAASDFTTRDPEFWRAQDIQNALKRSKYSEPTPRSVSQPKPIHGDESHIRTACEFAYTYLYLGMIDPPKKIARQMLDALKRAA